MRSFSIKAFTTIELLVIVVTLIIFGTGGVVVWEKIAQPILIPSPTPAPITSPVVTVGGPVTPRVSKNVRLPTVAPVIITPFPGSADEIHVVSSKSLYRKGEEVEVQVTNNSSQTISYHEGPGCGVYFQCKVGAKWQYQELCFTCFWASSEAPCLPETIVPNTWIKIVRPIENQARSGIYRAVFQYINGKAYSTEFQIL